MPRRSAGARLYLDKSRNTWVIRDGRTQVRTRTANRHEAEKQLATYIGQKHKPEPSNDPLIDDVLTVYGREHAPHTTRGGAEIAYILGPLLAYWSGKRVSDVTARACRAYPGGRKHLEILRAAIRFWHKEYGPLAAVPVVTLPPKGAPRDRWLTRSEAARLLWAARRVEYLKRFILLGLHTGSRAGVLFALQWSWIDLGRGVMRRRAPEEREVKNKRRPPVRVSRRLQSFLRRWNKQDGAKDGHVVHSHGHGMCDLRRGWVTACGAAGLGEDVTPHVLRHTRATWLMQAGVPIWEAAGSLGMTAAILESTYGHHSPNFQERAAEV